MPAVEFAKRLQDRNLPTPSGHYDLQRFLNASAVNAMQRATDGMAYGKTDLTK